MSWLMPHDLGPIDSDVLTFGVETNQKKYNYLYNKDLLSYIHRVGYPNKYGNWLTTSISSLLHLHNFSSLPVKTISKTTGLGTSKL